MKLSRKGIKWIYLNDDNVTKLMNTEKINEIESHYSMCLGNLIEAIKNGKNEESVNELCLKLDDIKCEEVAEYELKGYIHGFEMCMKLMNDN